MSGCPRSTPVLVPMYHPFKYLNVLLTLNHGGCRVSNWHSHRMLKGGYLPYWPDSAMSVIFLSAPQVIATRLPAANTSSTRRLVRRPSAVLFSAIGWCGP